MSKVILKDKKDLNTLRSKGWSKDGYEIVGSQDEITRDIDAVSYTHLRAHET